MVSRNEQLGKGQVGCFRFSNGQVSSLDSFLVLPALAHGTLGQCRKA